MLSIIKELCEKQGIGIRKLERECGLGVNTLSRWDRVAPSIDKVTAVADYFGVSIDSLVGRSAPEELPGAAQGLARPGYDMQLLEYAHQLNEEGQSRLLDYAEDLVAGGRFPLVADKAAS